MKEAGVNQKAYAVVALLGLNAGAVAAQGAKVSTPEELDKVMKKAGPAMQATTKAVGVGAYADVKTQIATVKQAVLDSQSFWVEHKREDALKFNKDTLAKLDEFSKLIESDTVDAAAAGASVKAVGGACRSCHQVYRATDADNNFILKPGSLGGQ